MNVVRLGRSFSGFVEAFTRVIPAPDIHHGYTALVVFFRGTRVLLRARLHTLLSDLDMHTGAIAEFFAGAFKDLLQFLFGAREFLLVKQGQSFVVELELRLDTRVHQLDATPLRWVRRGQVLLFHRLRWTRTGCFGPAR